MTAPRSLQGRLSLALGLGLGLLWIAASVWTVLNLRHELDEVFDSALEETAQRILPLAAIEIINRDADKGVQSVATLRPHKEFYTYLVRNAAGEVLIRSHSADPSLFPPVTRLGFIQTPTHRIYNDAALQGTITISLAEPLADRREAVWDAFKPLALPLGLFIPFSLLGIWAVVRLSIRPILSFRDAIAARSARDLAPVQADGLPTEVEPVARAVNALLARLGRTLEAERSFTANAAHELRTPVAAALAQTQRLLVETGESAARDRAREIETALKRLTRLSEKLMQLARAEGGQMRRAQPGDIAPVLAMVVRELQSPPADARLQLTLPSTPVLSDMDPNAFVILARNLMENALRHGAADAPVEVWLAADGVLRVINSGPVVPADRLAELTNRFQRGDTRAEGVGLGLSIAKAIAAGTGARLELRSPAPGRADGFEAALYPAADNSAQTG